MKKVFLMAAIAAMLVPFTSCNNKDTLGVHIPAAANSANAKKVTLTSPIPGKDGKKIKAVEFTDGGRYLITCTELKTKAVADEVTTYQTGVYTYANGVYTLDGFGTVAIDGNKITITAEGESAVETNGTVATPADNLSEMAQTWKVDKIDVSIITEGGTIGFVKDGCDLEQIAGEIIQQAAKLGANLEIDLGDFKGLSIDYVSFTSNKTIIVEFSNKTVYAGDLGSFLTVDNAYNFHYDLSNEGNDLINASADCQFIPKTERTAYFTMTVDLGEDGKSRVMFIMSKVN